MPKTHTAPRRDTLNLRIKPADRGLIDRAATLTGKTRTDFVLEAARRAAEDALLDRTVLPSARTPMRLFSRASTSRRSRMKGCGARCKPFRPGSNRAAVGAAAAQ